MRRRMEERLGANFSSVRVHAGPAAAAVAASKGARALSVGRDILFGAGRFDPASSEGQSLLTHELAHVVQQSGPGRAGDGAPGAEAEADAAAGAPEGSQFAVQHAAPVGIQRAPEWWTAAKAKAGAYVDKGAETVDAALDKASEKLADAAQTVADVAHEATTVVKDAYGAAKETAAEVKTAVVETAHDAKAAVVEKVGEVKARAAAAIRVAKAKTAEASATITNVANTVKEKAAAAAGDAWKQARRKAGDKVMRSAGQAKGVLLEVTNLVDSVLWLDYQGRKWAQRGVEKGLDWAEKKQYISKEAHQVAGAVYGEEFGTAKADRLRDAGVLKFDTDAEGKALDWGGPSITASVSPALDRYADMLGTAVGATPESEVTFFTEYELGEVEGAVGSQVALAFVGVEEVQLVLKGLGAIGGGKGLILSIERGDDWGTIGVNALNLVLAVIGLAKGKAAQKILAVASKLGALAGMYPPLKQLYVAYKSPKETTDPAAYRRELAAAASGVIKAGQAVVQSIIHARPGKTGATPAEETAGGGKVPSPTPSEGPVTAPAGTGTEAQPATAAPKATVQPPPEVVAPTPKPVVPQLEAAGGEATAPKPSVPVVTENLPPVVKQPPSAGATETTTPATKAPPPVQTETPPPIAKTPPVQTETPPATKAPAPTELEGPPPASKATETPDAIPAPAAAKAPPESEVPAPATRSLAATKAARTQVDSLIAEAKNAPPPTMDQRATQRAVFEAALEQTAYPNDRKAALRAAFEAAIEPTPPAQQRAKVAVGQDFEPEPEQPPKAPLQLVPSPETGSRPTVASAGPRGGAKPPPLKPARSRAAGSETDGSTNGGRLRDLPPSTRRRATTTETPDQTKPPPKVKPAAEPEPKAASKAAPETKQPAVETKPAPEFDVALEDRLLAQKGKAIEEGASKPPQETKPVTGAEATPGASTQAAKANLDAARGVLTDLQAQRAAARSKARTRGDAAARANQEMKRLADEALRTKDPAERRELDARAKAAEAKWQEAKGAATKFDEEASALDRDVRDQDAVVRRAEIDVEPTKHRAGLPCFAGDTPVWTVEGARPIKDLKAGDVVLSFDFLRDAVVESRVQAVHRNRTMHFYEVHAGGERVRVTGRHRIWVEGERRWFAVRDLVPGLHLRGPQDDRPEIDSIALEESFERPSWNLTIERTPSYFVGPGWLVHNDNVFDTGLGGRITIYRATSSDPRFANWAYIGQSVEVAIRETSHRRFALAKLQDRASLTPKEIEFYEFMSKADLEPLVTGLNKDQADFLEQRNINIEKELRGADNVKNRREQIGSDQHLKEVTDRIEQDPAVQKAGFCQK